MHGDTVYLRAVEVDDADALHDLLNDPETHLTTVTSQPFVPLSVANVRALLEQRSTGTADRTGGVWFTAVAQDGGMVLGIAAMFNLSSHNRVGEVGIALRPDARGKGYGRDILALLCRYGFRMRGLRRIGLGTAASNLAMRTIAERVGFIQEGVRRQHDYDGDGYRDVVVYGLLRDEWNAPDRGSERLS
jgi:RimJ/RimL family protein N-acetyltransferase